MAPKRNPFLDLLRCLAIVMVLVCHLTPADEASASRVLKLGGKGVDLFFVLSGWLLGEQLLREARDTGSINVKRFWGRRWLRTLPAYYTVFALTCGWLLWREKLGFEYTYYLIFAQTYLTKLPSFGVSWSLCVEEQFYLAVAPAVLLLYRRRWTLVLLPVLLALPAVCRALGWYGDLYQTHVRFDQCAVGVLLASIKVFAPGAWQRLCRWAPALAALGVSVIIGVAFCRATAYPGLDIDPLAWALIFSTFVLLGNSGPAWWNTFRFPGARYLADRSYAVYLLHPEAVALLRRVEGIPYALYCVLVCLLTLAAAEVLYRLVERPLIRLREHFSSTRSREGSRPRTAPPECTNPLPMPCAEAANELPESSPAADISKSARRMGPLDQPAMVDMGGAAEGLP